MRSLSLSSHRLRLGVAYHALIVETSILALSEVFRAVLARLELCAVPLVVVSEPLVLWQLGGSLLPPTLLGWLPREDDSSFVGLSHLPRQTPFGLVLLQAKRVLIIPPLPLPLLFHGSLAHKPKGTHLLCSANGDKGYPVSVLERVAEVRNVRELMGYSLRPIEST